MLRIIFEVNCSCLLGEYCQGRLTDKRIYIYKRIYTYIYKYIYIYIKGYVDMYIKIYTAHQKPDGYTPDRSGV